jgi:hypothetical protein
VSKHADVRAISRDPATYSSNPVSPLEEVDAPVGGAPCAPVLIVMDPPEHTRYRRLVSGGFTPRTMKMLEPHVRELAVRILDHAIEKVHEAEGGDGGHRHRLHQVRCSDAGRAGTRPRSRRPRAGAYRPRAINVVA